MKTLRFFFALLRVSIRASISLRGAFLLESALMVGNNLVFFSIWWIFFHKFDDIGGWQMRDMITLMAVGIGSYGLMQISFGGVKSLARIIISGNLDPFMTQPKNILLHLASSRSLSKGWGQLMTMVILIFLGGLTAPITLLLILLSILCGCLVFTAMGIIAHSLVFWLGSVERISKQYFDSLYLFAVYPTNIYSGFLKLVMFTLIPAGVIGYLPVELLRSFSWEHLLLLVGSSLAFFACAFFIFYLGLKRYESGNQFGMRL
jgi:ABC-2 type transport system permease protein